MLLWRKGGQEQTGEIDVKRPYVAAVVVAAGTSSRMQGLDKQLEDVGGIPVIVRTLLALSDSDWIDEIVLVTRRGTIPDMLALARAWGVPKIRSVIAGGQTRQQSVQLGVEAVGPQARYVAVHDGARPFVCGQVIADAVFDAIRYGAAAPAVPVSDTIKVADANGMIESTPDRSRLFAVQTPQVFELERYRMAAQAALQSGHDYTDDCQMLEAAGFPVHLSRGDSDNIKITTPVDLLAAQAIAKLREEMEA